MASSPPYSSTSPSYYPPTPYYNYNHDDNDQPTRPWSPTSPAGSRYSPIMPPSPRSDAAWYSGPYAIPPPRRCRGCSRRVARGLIPLRGVQAGLVETIAAPAIEIFSVDEQCYGVFYGLGKPSMNNPDSPVLSAYTPCSPRGTWPSLPDFGPGPTPTADSPTSPRYYFSPPKEFVEWGRDSPSPVHDVEPSASHEYCYCRSSPLEDCCCCPATTSDFSAI